MGRGSGDERGVVLQAIGHVSNKRMVSHSECHALQVLLGSRDQIPEIPLARADVDEYLHRLIALGRGREMGLCGWFPFTARRQSLP